MYGRHQWRQVTLATGIAALALVTLAFSAEKGSDPNDTFPTIGGAQPVVVPTFNCLSLYWAPAEGGADRTCAVHYRAAGERRWREALPLWFDVRNREYRGSVVNLAPDTSYQVELRLNGHARVVTARTWSEHFPIARTVPVPVQSDRPLVIDQSGTPNGYVLYAPARGKTATIDGRGKADTCVLIEASYVIVRGLTLKGAARNGITVKDGSHDLVIENCDISGWGRVLADGWGDDLDAGIFVRGWGVKRVVIQRNRIHHPRSNSNSWKEWRNTRDDGGYHPEGPQGVTFYNTSGNYVIRYNEVYSDERHRFNDGLGGGENFSYAGFPNRDSDIYGNRLSECWDDAIESEGANSNVRIWGNFITNTFVKIAIAGNSVGPVYIWRNVAGTARYSPFGSSDEDDHGPFLKAGAPERGRGGKAFIFHNTLLQAPAPAGLHKTLGCNVGLSSYGGEVLNMTSRNNILHIVSDESASIGSRTRSPSNDFDYDLYNGRIDASGGQEAHGIKGRPIFDPTDGPGRFWLAPGSPGYDAGVRIPNFNDGFTGKAPDLGAHEAGTAAMEFGVEAYRRGK